MHKVSIPDDVIAQVTRQRGKIERYERLEGRKTALVVIDLQNVFMLPGMPVEVPIAREIVPAVNRLADAVRKANGTVVWVRMNLEGETGPWSVYFDGEHRRAAYNHLLPGTCGFELHADLDVRPGDAILDKKRFSAFIQGSSDINDVLCAAGVDTIVLAGTLTNVCCESSARDAMMLNYKVVFVSDATAALTDVEHNATLATMIRVFGDVATTDDVISRLTNSVVEANAA